MHNKVQTWLQMCFCVFFISRKIPSSENSRLSDEWLLDWLIIAYLRFLPFKKVELHSAETINTNHHNSYFKWLGRLHHGNIMLLSDWHNDVMLLPRWHHGVLLVGYGEVICHHGDDSVIMVEWWCHGVIMVTCVNPM